MSVRFSMLEKRKFYEIYCDGVVYPREKKVIPLRYRFPAAGETRHWINIQITLVYELTYLRHVVLGIDV